MSKQQTVLVVDDAPDNRLLLKSLLEQDYNVIEVSSGKACLELVELNPPDLILLDVNMPGISGYEVCVQLRKNLATQATPVIFVSALDSSEERLAGFEAGADDYLTKPVDGVELFKKVAFRLQRKQEISIAKAEATNAMNVAMEAMTSSSELGQIIQFLKSVQDIKSQEKVASAVIDIAKQFGLKVSALIIAQPHKAVGCEQESLEAKLMEKFVISTDRITHKGIRTIIRSDSLVLLVKNMPLEDESRYGRLKDHLAVLADIANGRLQALSANLLLEEHKKILLQKVIKLAEKQIKLTREKIFAHTNTVNRTMENMLTELENMLFGLGLDEDQEKKLMKLADRTSLKLNESNADTVKLDAELGVVLEALYGLLQEKNSR